MLDDNILTTWVVDLTPKTKQLNKSKHNHITDFEHIGKHISMPNWTVVTLCHVVLSFMIMNIFLPLQI